MAAKAIARLGASGALLFAVITLLAIQKSCATSSSTTDIASSDISCTPEVQQCGSDEVCSKCVSVTGVEAEYADCAEAYFENATSLSSSYFEDTAKILCNAFGRSLCCSMQVHEDIDCKANDQYEEYMGCLLESMDCSFDDMKCMSSAIDGADGGTSSTADDLEGRTPAPVTDTPAPEDSGSSQGMMSTPSPSVPGGLNGDSMSLTAALSFESSTSSIDECHSLINVCSEDEVCKECITTLVTNSEELGECYTEKAIGTAEEFTCNAAGLYICCLGKVLENKCLLNEAAVETFECVVNEAADNNCDVDFGSACSSRAVRAAHRSGIAYAFCLGLLATTGFLL